MVGSFSHSAMLAENKRTSCYYSTGKWHVWTSRRADGVACDVVQYADLMFLLMRYEDSMLVMHVRAVGGEF